MKKHITLCIFFLCLPFYVSAGGVILYEISSADTRLASAGWSARAQDPSTVFTNPAGMTRLCGKQAELGAQAIFAHIHFDPDDETTVQGSDGDADIWLPSGSLFYVHPYNECLTFGIGSLGYFGSDLVYNHSWVGRYYVQKVMLEGLSLVPAAAYKINEQWSIGVGANVMYGFLKQRTAIRNVLDSIDDGYVIVGDRKFSCGALFGVLYESNCNLRFGIQYLTPVHLNFKTTPHFHDLGPQLESYLKDVGIIGSRVDVHVNVPQSVMFSVYQQINPCWAFMANVGWQQWSRFQEVSVALADLNQTTLTSKVKYEDTWHTAVGVEWYCLCNLTLSCGVAYDSSAVTTKERPLFFPVGRQWRFGSGARWEYSDNLIFDFSTELQWQGDLKADVNGGAVAGHVSGTFTNTYCLFINANLIYKF